jgi:hypothetical protein
MHSAILALPRKLLPGSLIHETPRLVFEDEVMGTPQVPLLIWFLKIDEIQISLKELKLS